MVGDPWADFPDEPGSKIDPFAEFPDAPGAKGSKPKRQPKIIREGVAVQPVDGDTLRPDAGPNWRVFGIDAPELQQPGYMRDGSTVPVGQQSRYSLQGLVDGQPVNLGPQQGASYGRPVGPVAIGGNDIGQTMIRDGGAFAAPDYLGDDPARRFDYLQAERLARLNKLGVHDAYVQEPAEYRSAPDAVPDKQTVARFWDEPTPFAGMRPEAEKQYLDMLLGDGTVEQVVQFLESQGGFNVDPAEVQAFISKREAAKAKGEQINVDGVPYRVLPPPLTDVGDGALGAGVRSYAGGLLADGLDEIGAVADTLGATPGRENVWNSDSRLADIWANNQRQNASILGFDEFANPDLTTAGKIAGAVTTGFAIPYGAGATTVPALARAGGAFGAAEGFLGSDGGIGERITSGIVGAGAGAALNAVGGKALQAALPAIGRGVQRLRGRDGVQPELQPSQLAPEAPASSGETAPPLPPQPMAMASDEPSVAGRVRDVIDLAPSARPQRMDESLSDGQMRARAENIEPQDVLPVPSNAVDQIDDTLPVVDETQPFGALEAVEDWPSDTITRAGNIDVARLDAPQDIARALQTTVDRVGFDAATRGRVTHAETERLAEQMGMSADTLLARRKGQAFNAEEALAARQILAKSANELVNMAKRVRGLEDPGDEMLVQFRQAWMRHVAIQEQVAGATAEAGRALQQFKMTASAKAVRGQVLGAMVRAGGGRDNLMNAAEALIEAVEAGPGVFNTLAHQATKPKLKDKLSELYTNMLLSGPQTHVVNVSSNTLTSLAQIPEYAAGALVGGARQAFTRNAVDRVTASEVGARAFGLLQGAREGASMFASALRSGEASDFISKIEGNEFRAISGVKGEVIRIPSRFLIAEDEFFKGVARRMEMSAQAVRVARNEGLKGSTLKARIADLTANPTDEMMETAFDYGRYLTFQRKLGPIASKVSAITGDSMIAKVILPFVRTPTNLLKFAAERSPAAPAMREWRKDFAAGGARRDMAIARSVVGTGFGFAVYEAALSGHISGAAPKDQAKARLFYADGRKPYSVRIGDQWFSYKRMDPFATTLGVAADMATLPEGMSEKQRDDKATLLVASILGNLEDKSWLSGVSSLLAAINEPDRYADKFVARLVGSFLIPTGVAQVARNVDPVQRETEGVRDVLMNRLPWASKQLMPRRDIWGREIRSEGGLGPDILSPVWVSTQLNDPVNTELIQLDYAPSYPNRTIGGVELSAEDYDKYTALAGKAAYDQLSETVATPEWRSLDDAGKVKAAKKIVSEARRDARSQLFNGGDDDPWSAFPDAKREQLAKDPFNDFPDAPQRDVIGRLETAIPGVRFTSGFRSREYQEDMKHRGYKPADNSPHLEGGALDMLPPAGRSMEWLKAQVRRLEPQASLLIHDGHLHAEFPDWQGAPVIGNAKGRGFDNPAAR